MWQVAVGWHAMEFAQTSAVLKFYTWFQFWRYHRSRHVILHQSAKFLSKSDHPQQKEITSCRFSRWRILDFRGPIMGSLKSHCATSYRSSIETIALNCLVFEKIAFLQFGDRKQTDRQTNRWTRPSHEAALAIASGGLIKWDIGQKSRFFSYLLHSTPRSGGHPYWNNCHTLLLKNQNSVATRQWKSLRIYL